jgi:hypothetical protein
MGQIWLKINLSGLTKEHQKKAILITHNNKNQLSES